LLQDYQLINPRLYHARHKREIASSRDDGGASGGHLSHLTVAFTLAGGEKEMILDLQLNRDLLPQGYFEKYHHKVQPHSHSSEGTSVGDP
jgi:hypothetical protein